jgi:hypothetical protein
MKKASIYELITNNLVAASGQNTIIEALHELGGEEALKEFKSELEDTELNAEDWQLAIALLKKIDEMGLYGDID